MSFLKIEKMDLLIAVYIFCIVVSQVMGAKTFPLVNIFGFQINQTVSIFVFPLIFIFNDIINEVFGPERARSIIRSSLIVILLIFIYSIIATTIPPSSRFASSENAYDQIFGLSARFSLASLIAFISSDFLDVYIFARMRKALGKNGLWLRVNVSNFLSQFVDTVVFMVLAFWALDQSFSGNFAFILGLLIPYWIVKCLISVVETPLVYLGVSWLKAK
jgi:uncharacterized integral membrane protein (TIGR00697 family)